MRASNNDGEENPAFDCVEFQRRAQSEIYEQIKDMSHEEQIEFYRREAASGPLGEWWRMVKNRSQLSPDSSRDCR